MDGDEESPPNTHPPSEDLTISLLGRLRRAGSAWLGGGGATIPPPADDMNTSLDTSVVVVRKRGRPPKTPTTPTFQVLSPSGGDEEPGPSTLDSSRLAVTAPRPPRKSVSSNPSNPDAKATAINWILEHIQVSDNPTTTIIKSEIVLRYTQFCEGMGVAPHIDSALGKRIKECFPHVTTKRLGGKNNLQSHYVGITWVELARQQQQHSQQQQQRGGRFQEELSQLHMSVPTLRRVSKRARS